MEYIGRHPETENEMVYRINTDLNRWEYWSNYDGWSKSYIVITSAPDWKIVKYEDTWCEPFREI